MMDAPIASALISGGTAIALYLLRRAKKHGNGDENGKASESDQSVGVRLRDELRKDITWLRADNESIRDELRQCEERAKVMQEHAIELRSRILDLEFSIRTGRTPTFIESKNRSDREEQRLKDVEDAKE